MPALIMGQDLLFWIAVLLTVVFFIDLGTCWWATGLKIYPLKKYQGKLTKYHKYTRVLLIFLVIIHLIFHVLFQVFGIIF
ncbi:MAG: hypothetical protein A2663_03015 [Candidatus Buchananbacteria bacterium RIFCSPHIGHO2_01_FULL_46_12]|uniref:Uncharacterized protein n=3 Tax=Candidatus Buchananiibacteriota TaxID=1817903 RepID=A0A1G1Y258_9BACT|nr:MAG: hypothetical protein A2663_03015 [Candidatus Buchananbacteria bacterium RIFCSPHIGHO2_01_FULL_46_12]